MVVGWSGEYVPLDNPQTFRYNVAKASCYFSQAGRCFLAVPGEL